MKKETRIVVGLMGALAAGFIAGLLVAPEKV